MVVSTKPNQEKAGTEETTTERRAADPNIRSNEDVWFDDGEASDNESPVEKLARSLSSKDSWSDGGAFGENSLSKKKRRDSGKVKPYYDPMDTDTDRKDWRNHDDDDDEIVTPEEESSEEVKIVNVKNDFDETAPTLPVLLLRLFRNSTKKQKGAPKPKTNEETVLEEDQDQPGTTDQKSEENDSTVTAKETEKLENLEESTDSKHSTEAKADGGDENENRQDTAESLPALLFRKLTSLRQKPAEKIELTEDEPAINYNGKASTKYCPICGQVWEGYDIEEGRMVENKENDDFVFEGKLSDSKMWRAIWVQGDVELDWADSKGKIYRSEFKMDVTGKPTFKEGVTMSMNKNVEIGRIPGRF